MLYEINDKNKILEQISNRTFLYFSPIQMNLFEEKFFDVTLAIDCLQDMDKKIVNLYLNYINRYFFLFLFWYLEKNWFF